MGKRMPTKTTSRSAISRAAAATISSPKVKADAERLVSERAITNAPYSLSETGTDNRDIGQSVFREWQPSPLTPSVAFCGVSTRAAAQHVPLRKLAGEAVPASVACKIWFTFLEERVQAFQAIMRFEAMPLQADLFVERGFQLLAVFLNHAMFYITLRETRSGGNALSELFGFSFQLIGGNHATDDSQAKRFIRGQHLAGIEQLGRARGANNPR